MVSFVTQNRAKRLIKSLLGRLFSKYGQPGIPCTDPFDELLNAILSADSSEKLAIRAKRRLMRDFVDWNEVRVATTEEIEDSLKRSRVSGPVKKSEMLKWVLWKTFDDRNVMNLDLLKNAGPRKARRYLGGFDSVPQSVIDRVLLRSLGMPTIPATSAVVRTLKRVGVLPEECDETRAKTFLEKAVPKSDWPRFYLLLERHAEDVCQFNTYRCRACYLRKSCSFARAGTRKTSPGKQRPKR